MFSFARFFSPRRPSVAFDGRNMVNGSACPLKKCVAVLSERSISLGFVHILKPEPGADTVPKLV